MNKSSLKKYFFVASVLLASMIALSCTGTPILNPVLTSDPTPCQGDCDFTRGPNPTVSSLEASTGPYFVAKLDVSSSVSGFGGGTLHYPTNATGKMGVIAVIPGYLLQEFSIKFWGPKLASHGFLVLTISANSGFDQPASRATQLGRALDYVINQSNDSNSPILGMVDANRLGVVGWSMGGGGALRLASGDRLSAAISIAPWDKGSNSFDQIETPTFVIACEDDNIAPVITHASPFYNRIPSTTQKAYLEVKGGSHFCANDGGSIGELLGKYGVSWMKRFIDNDLRYHQFLCGPEHATNVAISEYRETCNL